MSVRKTRTFQQIFFGNEYNAVVDFQLSTWIFRLKYKLYQMKDNLFLCFVFINNKKMRAVSENTKSKTKPIFFSMWMDMLWQVQKATGSWKYWSLDLQYLMFNSNLKLTIKPRTSFQDT